MKGAVFGVFTYRLTVKIRPFINKIKSNKYSVIVEAIKIFQQSIIEFWR